MRYSPIVLLFFTTAVFSQNKVETVGEFEYFGEVVRNDQDTMVLRLRDSSMIHIPKTSILAVYYDVAERQNSQYWSVGGTVGTPSGLQVVGSYDIDRYGVRTSIGIVGEIAGAQLNIFRKLHRANHFSHELSGILGFTNQRYFRLIDGELLYNYLDEYYLGVGYSAHWYGFFGEIGIASGVDPFFHPQVLLQLGYIHEFR
jgi:hypothetical protein